MNLDLIKCVLFSPTGTTKKVVEAITQGIGGKQVEMVDVTRRSQRGMSLGFEESDLAILAAPVYYGRIPEEIASYFATLSAKGTPVVPVVVYGNREYEDALKELTDIAVSGNFVPVAGGAFIAQHSYSTDRYPIADGRPDADDLQKAARFGAAVREKLSRLESLRTVSDIAVPGRFPYVEPKNLNDIKRVRQHVALTPETDSSKCTQCGQCAEACPTGAIVPDDVAQTDRFNCLICFACIKACPEDARQMREPNFWTAIEALAGTCQERKQPEWYL